MVTCSCKSWLPPYCQCCQSKLHPKWRLDTTFNVCFAGFTPLIWYVIHFNGPTAKLEKPLWEHSSWSARMSRKSVFLLDIKSHDCSFFFLKKNNLTRDVKKNNGTLHRFYGEYNSSEQMLLKQVKVSARRSWPHVSRHQREKNKRGMQGWRCARSSRSGVWWNLFIAVGVVPPPWLCSSAVLSLFSTWTNQLWSTIFTAHMLQFQPKCFIWPGGLQVSIKHRKDACEDFRLLNQVCIWSRWKNWLPDYQVSYIKMVS